ncbi:MAG: AEC family transporter [Ruminococcaceae bacterium]|nr:AEC family transporter [Oscillospiraceae bacterium]
MLDSFVFSLNATLPVFLLILVGMLLRRIGIFTEEYAAMTDRFVFKIALPVLLFKDISGMSLRDDFDGGFVIFCAVASVLMFLVPWGFAALFMKNKGSVGAFSQGCARGSAAVLGVALAENICGSAGMAPIMIFAAVPIFNILSVVILSFSAEGQEKKPGVGELLKNIVTNPIIWGVLLGLPFSFFDVSLPHIAQSAVGSIASTATPLALMAIGASFDFGAAKGKFVPAAVASFVKLILLPAAVIPVAAALGFRDSALVSVFIMVGAPTTVAAYIMAKNMKNDHVLSSNIVMLSTLLSSVTITFWVFLMRYLGFI